LDLESIVYIQTVQCTGQHGSSWHLCFISRGVYISLSVITVNFLLGRNELISLIKLDEKFNWIVYAASEDAMQCQRLF